MNSHHQGTRNLKKGKGKCDLTGMYDVLETATFFELGVPATDTAKLSLICFDDEEEFEGWGCLMYPEECDRRRNLKESFVQSLDASGRKLEHEDVEQFCYFEYLGFPDIRRDLEESSNVDGDRKLQPGIHNTGFAYVIKEDPPFPTGKNKKICAAFTDGENALGLGAFAVQVKDGVLGFAIGEVEPDLGPYFAFKTTK